MPSSRGSSPPRDWHVSCLLPWQVSSLPLAPPSVYMPLTVTPFESQNCPRDLPNPGIEPRSPALQADSLPTELPRKSKEPSHIWPLRPYTLHPVPLNMSSHFLTTFLFFSIRISIFFLHSPCLSPEISHLFKSPDSFKLKWCLGAKIWVLLMFVAAINVTYQWTVKKLICRAS